MFYINKLDSLFIAGNLPWASEGFSVRVLAAMNAQLLT